jgi:hypothetical protein
VAVTQVDLVVKTEAGSGAIAIADEVETLVDGLDLA